MRQRLGVAALPGTEANFQRRRTPAQDHQSLNRRANDMVAPGFGSSRAGFSGVGLTSGLKFGQPANIGEFEPSITRGRR